MYLIRGTQFELAQLFDRLRKEIAASVNYMAGGNCVFPAVSKVVAHISKTRQSDKPIFLTVSGHSLGGTATQYVAADRESKPHEYGSQFAAYSFNAIGLTDLKYISGLYSYLVWGDWFQVLPGSQVGTVMTYRANDFRWKIVPFARHTLRSVQESICRCCELQKGDLNIDRL